VEDAPIFFEKKISRQHVIYEPIFWSPIRAVTLLAKKQVFKAISAQKHFIDTL
jgi:hypothetical protein